MLEYITHVLMKQLTAWLTDISFGYWLIVCGQEHWNCGRGHADRHLLAVHVSSWV